mmetsp:Transcript_48259/g.134744  ORF Transcript_48259/g.134744 Transcript_48259/m.134744 type:complete len:796 (+) Transcript_48259:96-2483(+)
MALDGTVAAIVKFLVRLSLAAFALRAAYMIRMYAVDDFGRVIHEFDPWFNYRAAEYLAAHGREQFFKWFDHSVWYPLGRPVGTTIYPGMQFVSVWIWQALNAVGVEMSLNDVCVFTPAWFGVATTAFLGLLTYECSGSADAGVFAAVLMSVIPAHIMRSVAGAYDNECVAMCFFCCTFYLWCRSLRSSNSWFLGAVTGVSYFAMVASWGGYVYVLNMIGVHAGILVVMGRHSTCLHRSYSLFYLVGTSLAIQVPVVGLAPLRSLEQMGPMGVFWLLQATEFCEVVRRRRGLSQKDFHSFRLHVFLVLGAVAAVTAAALFQAGYFGPLSARVRGLFVKHTKTGNPLVDSVAEHQATSPRAYWQYLYFTCYLAPIGFIVSTINCSDRQAFLLLYSAVTYYFSSKMNRLVLLLGPAAASLSGVALAKGVHWAWGELYELLFQPARDKTLDGVGGAKPAEKKDANRGPAASAKKSAGGKATKAKKPVDDAAELKVVDPFTELYNEAASLRYVAACLFFPVLAWFSVSFWSYCHSIAKAVSTPDIMFKTKLSDGTVVLVDDYREAYFWLRDNTPEDSRVMAWWDYGYQINGVANRTTIADGNTWNHEHIATLGRCLTNPEKSAYDIVRHLADYVLVWAGSQSDDLAKSPHMARIANSVYSDLCPGDPTCRSFGFDAEGKPTEMMRESLLFKLHSHGSKDVEADPTMFEEAYKSKYGLVRIFKVLNISVESKAWVADPRNKLCDAPGSWYCPGQYPPALDKLFEKKKAFRQLEDFNSQRGDADSDEYQKAYFDKMQEKHKS